MPTYIAHDSISRSELSTLNSKTPYHYMFSKAHGNFKQTPDLLVGSAVHKIFLERETFDEDFAVAPNLNLRTKAGKEEFAIFSEEAKGKGQEVLTVDQMAKVKAIGDALHSQKRVTNLVKGGVAERSIFRPLNGLMLKSRPDYYIESSNTILDLKTTRDATTSEFLRSIIKYQYYRQDAYYSDSVAHFTGEIPRFIFIAVEKEPPYQANLIELEPSFKMVGRAEYLKALSRIKECQDNDYWPSFSEEPVKLDCPEWLWERFKSGVQD